MTIDGAPTAVEIARRRLAGVPGVELLLGTIPAAIPDGPFDLVVASEILYYLTAEELAATLDRLCETDGARQHGSSPSTGDQTVPSGRSTPTTSTRRCGVEPWLRRVERAGTDDYRLDVLERR